MSIVVNCPSCNKGYQVGDDKAGRRFRCRSCEEVITVPQAKKAAASSDPWAFDDGDDDEFGSSFGSSAGGSSSRGSSSRSGGSRKKKKKSSQGSKLPLAIAGIAGAGVLVALVMALLWFTGGDELAEDGTPPNYTPPATPVLPAEERIQTDFIPGNSFAALSINPKRMLKSPLFENLPIDQMLQAVGPQGVTMEDLEGVTMAMMLDDAVVDDIISMMDEAIDKNGNVPDARRQGEKIGEQVGFAFIVKMKKDVDLGEFLKASPAFDPSALTETTIDGKTAWKQNNPDGANTAFAEVVMFQPNGTTILLANSEAAIERMLATSSSTSGPIIERFKRTSNDSDIAMLLSVEALQRVKDKIQEVIEAARSNGEKVPAEAERMIQELEAASLVLDLSAPKGSDFAKLTVFCDTETGASEVKQSLDDAKVGLPFLMMGLQGQIARASGPQKAAGQKLMQAVQSLSIEQDGNTVVLTVKSPGLEGMGPVPAGGSAPNRNPGGEGSVGFGQFGGTEDSRDAMREKITAKNHLRQLGLAFHNFHDVHSQFPGARVMDGNYAEEKGEGDLLVSPLALLLPYLEYSPLFDQLKPGVKWNEGANKALLNQRPRTFAIGGEAPTKTRIRFFGSVDGGPNAYLRKGSSTRMRDITDGLSNSILAVIVSPENAVEWLNPEPLKIHKGDPVKTLAEVGKIPESGLIVLLFDGSVMTLPADIDPEQFYRMVTTNGGEIVDPL